MLSMKVRTAVITLVASTGFAGTSVVPAASQAMRASRKPTATKIVPVVHAGHVGLRATGPIHLVSTKAALEGHSNGRPGSLSDGDCETAAHEYNEASDQATKAAGVGDVRGFVSSLNSARMTLEWFRAGGCVAT